MLYFINFNRHYLNVFKHVFLHFFYSLKLVKIQKSCDKKKVKYFHENISSGRLSIVLKQMKMGRSVRAVGMYTLTTVGKSPKLRIREVYL